MFYLFVSCILVFGESTLTNQAGLPEIDFKNAVEVCNKFYEQCAPQVTCDCLAPYRTLNSTCNNLENPLWGATETPFVRLGPANYADCEYQMRVQSNGKPLPGPRELQFAISMISSSQVDKPDVRNSHVNHFGQWLTHDISLMSPDFTKPADCCSIQGSNDIPPNCQAIIPLLPDDKVYSSCGTPSRTCMAFRRAKTAALNFNCPITPQIQVNEATPFIDASQLYGHTSVKAESLRSFVDGKLKTEMLNGREFCPQQKRDTSDCGARENVCVCFDHGDVRSNQHFGIILYSEMFVRLHNKIADSLKQVNPDWQDETLYMEARKIVGALNQIFAYRDFLPFVLGADYSEQAGLTVSKSKKTTYDPKLMPQVSTELSAGSLRVLHNVIPSEYSLMDENNKVKQTLKLHEFMFIPDLVVEGDNFEQLLRGMSVNPGRYPSQSYNFGITNFMFHNMKNTIADSDLLARDIQRGRDAGILTYTQVRDLCGLSPVKSFDDFKTILSPEAAKMLEQNYASVADVDLVVGSLLEPLVSGGMVGETTRCVMADAFYRIRYGDRFFFDVQGQPGSFSDEQLEVLWNVDLTTVFCGTSDIDKLPCDIFMPNSGMRNCEKFNLDLQAWACK